MGLSQLLENTLRPRLGLSSAVLRNSPLPPHAKRFRRGSVVLLQVQYAVPTIYDPSNCS